MNFTGQIYRPPTEAWTPLLEVTYGCSHNECIYCVMYDETPFGIAKKEQIEEDILELKERWIGPLERIYLTGGDPFVLSIEKLLEISNLIHQHLKEIKTITCYASLYNFKNKTVEDLKKLKEAGYNEIYIGIETGFDPALKFIKKGVNREESFEEIKKLKEAGLEYMAILMSGVAGRGRGKENAIKTAELLNCNMPKSIGMMTTAVKQGSELYTLRESGEFVEASMRENLEEQITFLEEIRPEDPEKVIFTSQHIGNTVRIYNTLDHKEEMIKTLKEALEELPEEILSERNRRLTK